MSLSFGMGVVSLSPFRMPAQFHGSRMYGVHAILECHALLAVACFPFGLIPDCMCVVLHPSWNAAPSMLWSYVQFEDLTEV
jgi:hypothetical protein